MIQPHAFPSDKRKQPTTYGSVVGMVALAVFIRWLFHPLLAGQSLFPLFLGVAVVALWPTGWKAALTATLLGGGAETWFFLQSNAAPAPFFIALAVYLSSSFCLILLHRSQHTKRRPLVSPSNTEMKTHLQTEINRHQKTAAALQESSELFELLVKSVEDYAIFMLDRNGIIVSWNRGAERIKGYKAEEIIGQSFSRFYTKEDQQNGMPMKALATAVSEGHFEGEALRVRKDGSTFYANVVITAVYNDDGELIGFAKVTRDSTKRRAVEESLQKAKVELEHRIIDRMAVIQELEAFSYSVSHDLRAPLRQVQGLSQALIEDYEDQIDEEGKLYMRHIQAACTGMELLINELLKLSQLTIGKLDQQETDLSQAAKEISLELKRLHPNRNIEFVIDKTPLIAGDPTLLRVVLYNLFENSVKFTGPNTTAKIEFGEQDGAFFVRDNGVGFDMQYVDRLFGPFQRLHTQAEFPGTGVGLATVQRILRQHNGRIWVESNPGHNTTFYFTVGTMHYE